MNDATLRALARITSETGAGDTAQGFALFDAPELHALAEIPIERLHCLYGYESAIRYLAQLAPADAAELARQSGVELC
jgi:hypothetical protein